MLGAPSITLLAVAVALVPLLHVEVLLDAALPLRGGVLPALAFLGLVYLLGLSVYVRAVGAVRSHHGAVVALVGAAWLRVLLHEVRVLGVSAAGAAVQDRHCLQRRH